MPDTNTSTSIVCTCDCCVAISALRNRSARRDLNPLDWRRVIPPIEHVHAPDEIMSGLAPWASFCEYLNAVEPRTLYRADRAAIISLLEEVRARGAVSMQSRYNYRRQMYGHTYTVDSTT